MGNDSDQQSFAHPLWGSLRTICRARASNIYLLKETHERDYLNTHSIFATASVASVAFLLAAVLAGCKSTAPATDDTNLNTQVQSRLFSDQNLTGQAIQTSVSGGVVTLSGSVTSDTARIIASGDAGQVAGVKTVINNLVVQPPAAAPAVAAAPAPEPMPPAHDRDRDHDKSKKHSAAQPQPAPIVRNNPAPEPLPVPQPQPPAPVAQLQPPPPAPAPPVVHNITLPAGTAIPVRITQTLDSATTQTGDKFTGAIASDIIVDGMVVLPQGAPVTGHVDEAKDAAHFKGSSLLTISLTSISHKGDRVQVATDPYSKQGEGRGKNSAGEGGRRRSGRCNSRGYSWRRQGCSRRSGGRRWRGSGRKRHHARPASSNSLGVGGPLQAL